MTIEYLSPTPPLISLKEHLRNGSRTSKVNLAVRQMILQTSIVRLIRRRYIYILILILIPHVSPLLRHSSTSYSEVII
jgi:hypothetical protein